MMIDSSGSSIIKRKSKNAKLIPLQGTLDTISYSSNTFEASNVEINNPHMYSVSRSPTWTYCIEENTG